MPERGFLALKIAGQSLASGLGAGGGVLAITADGFAAALTVIGVAICFLLSRATPVFKDIALAAVEVRGKMRAVEKVTADIQATATGNADEIGAMKSRIVEADRKLANAKTEALALANLKLAEAKAEADRMIAEALTEADRRIAKAKAEADRKIAESLALADRKIAEAKAESDQRHASSLQEAQATADIRRQERELATARVLDLESRLADLIEKTDRMGPRIETAARGIDANSAGLRTAAAAIGIEVPNAIPMDGGHGAMDPAPAPAPPPAHIETPDPDRKGPARA